MIFEAVLAEWAPNPRGGLPFEVVAGQRLDDERATDAILIAIFGPVLRPVPSKGPA